MPRAINPYELPEIPNWVNRLRSAIFAPGKAIDPYLGPLNPLPVSDADLTPGSVLTTIPNKTVYHGTTAAFKNFKPSPKGQAGFIPQWTHFSEDPEWANRFAKGFRDDKGARIIPAQLPQGEYIDFNDSTMNFADLAKLKSAMSPNQLKQFNFFSGYENSSLDNILRNMLEADPKLFHKAGFTGIRYLDAGNPAWAFDPKKIKLTTPWGTPLTSIGGLK